MPTLADDRLLARLTTTILGVCSPDRIILFGSRARGDASTDSDYDLFVVLPDADCTAGAEQTMRDALRESRTPVDLVVRSASRYDHRRSDVGTLDYAADADGKVLYERTPSTRPRRVREQPGVPESLAEWIERAESDFIAMSKVTGDPRVLDVTVFHAHQTAEKYLKAALVRERVRPPRTHTLTDLLALQFPAVRDDSAIRAACRLLDDLWPKSRYPELPLPTVEEAAAAVNAATTIRISVRAALPDAERLSDP